MLSLGGRAELVVNAVMAEVARLEVAGGGAPPGDGGRRDDAEVNADDERNRGLHELAMAWLDAVDCALGASAAFMGLPSSDAAAESDETGNTALRKLLAGDSAGSSLTPTDSRFVHRRKHVMQLAAMSGFAAVASKLLSLLLSAMEREDVSDALLSRMFDVMCSIATHFPAAFVQKVGEVLDLIVGLLVNPEVAPDLAGRIRRALTGPLASALLPSPAFSVGPLLLQLADDVRGLADRCTAEAVWSSPSAALDALAARVNCVSTLVRALLVAAAQPERAVPPLLPDGLIFADAAQQEAFFARFIVLPGPPAAQVQRAQLLRARLCMQTVCVSVALLGRKAAVRLTEPIMHALEQAGTVAVASAKAKVARRWVAALADVVLPLTARAADGNARDGTLAVASLEQLLRPQGAMSSLRLCEPTLPDAVSAVQRLLVELLSPGAHETAQLQVATYLRDGVTAALRALDVAASGQEAESTGAEPPLFERLRLTHASLASSLEVLVQFARVAGDDCTGAVLGASMTDIGLQLVGWLVPCSDGADAVAMAGTATASPSTLLEQYWPETYVRALRCALSLCTSSTVAVCAWWSPPPAGSARDTAAGERVFLVCEHLLLESSAPDSDAKIVVLEAIADVFRRAAVPRPVGATTAGGLGSGRLLSLLTSALNAADDAVAHVRLASARAVRALADHLAVSPDALGCSAAFRTACARATPVLRDRAYDAHADVRGAWVALGAHMSALAAGWTDGLDAVSCIDSPSPWSAASAFPGTRLRGTVAAIADLICLSPACLRFTGAQFRRVAGHFLLGPKVASYADLCTVFALAGRAEVLADWSTSVAASTVSETANTPLSVVVAGAVRCVTPVPAKASMTRAVDVGAATAASGVVVPWVLAESARFVVRQRLQTEFGGPMEFFDLLESSAKAHLAKLGSLSPDADPRPRAAEDAARSAWMFVRFFTSLEKQLLNVLVGGLSLHPPPNGIIAWYQRNKAVCHLWMSRLRPWIVRVAGSIGAHALVVEQGHQVLADWAEMVRTKQVSKART